MAAKPPIDEKSLNEILDGICKAELLPSDRLVKALAKASGLTETIIKHQFTALYQQAGFGDDPWEPVPPIMG